MEYEVGVDESVTTAIVRAVSAVDGRQPRSLPPLSHVIDPDALDALFDSRYDGEPRIGGRLSFIYNRCRVTVDNGEYLTIQLLDDDPRVSDDRERGRWAGTIARRSSNARGDCAPRGDGRRCNARR